MVVSHVWESETFKKKKLGFFLGKPKSYIISLSNYNYTLSISDFIYSNKLRLSFILGYPVTLSAVQLLYISTHIKCENVCPSLNVMSTSPHPSPLITVVWPVDIFST